MKTTLVTLLTCATAMSAAAQSNVIDYRFDEVKRKVTLESQNHEVQAAKPMPQRGNRAPNDGHGEKPHGSDGPKDGHPHDMPSPPSHGGGGGHGAPPPSSNPPPPPPPPRPPQA